MAAVIFGDELVRDYLVYRGFLTALKVFDSEVKADKDRGFRPDRIVEHLSSCITNLDLNALREAWAHLEQRVFSRLEHSFLSKARKLENALLFMYLVTCISASRQDKLLDFFEKMTPELQGQSEWREWFALPFLKNADENPIFAVYFTRQWQDTMLVSLHNFISVVFQSMATPSLLSYEEELIRLNSLQEENDILKAKLASILKQTEDEKSKNAGDFEQQDVFAPAELMDDFYVIAQEAPAENMGRSMKSLFRNISSGLPASPILTRHVSEGRRSEDPVTANLSKASKIKPRSPSVPPQLTSKLSSPDASRASRQEPSPKAPASKEELAIPEVRPKSASATSTSKPRSAVHISHSTIPVLTDPKSGFLILSQEEYFEHHSFITHCLFNSSGSIVASSDKDGVIKQIASDFIHRAKPSQFYPTGSLELNPFSNRILNESIKKKCQIWNASPAIHTLTTIMSKTSALALEWAPKRERLLLHGSALGKVRLYDVKERRIVGEVSPSSTNAESHKILHLSCNPTEANFVVSSENDNQGSLSLYNLRTLQLEHSLPVESKSVCCYCSCFNHNGQLLLVGGSNGHSYIYDLRTYQSIASWVSHPSSVLAIQFSSDETTCYTMSQDGKFIQWSINKTGHPLAEMAIHSGSPADTSPQIQPSGKLFAFNNDANHFLTCGPVGGVIYKVTGNNFSHALNIGGHNHPVATVDWSTAMECSTCLCGSTDGKITVTTLMTQ